MIQEILVKVAITGYSVACGAAAYLRKPLEIVNLDPSAKAQSLRDDGSDHPEKR